MCRFRETERILSEKKGKTTHIISNGIAIKTKEDVITMNSIIKGGKYVSKRHL